MKKLNSQLNRFKASNNHSLACLAVILVAVGLIAFSCRKRVDIQETSTKDLQPFGEAIGLTTTKQVVSPGWTPLRDTGLVSSDIVAWLGASSCIESILKLKTNLLTGFGSSEILLEQSWGPSTTILASIEGVNIQFAGGALTENIKEQLCTQVQADGGAVTIPTSIANTLKSAIELDLAILVPDCRTVEIGNEGWVCGLATLMPQSAIIAVEDFQHAMIRRWSRQPYVLARRAGVTMSLAKAATNLAQETNIHKFCKLLQFSLPEELPLVMTSGRWQKWLCDGNERQRRDAAYHGLAKAVDELSMIRQLYESTSKVGMLSIKIPAAEIPGNVMTGLLPLRVTVTPDAEVTDRLIEVAESMLGRPRLDSRKPNRRTASLAKTILPFLEHRRPQCWHPIFGDSSALMRVADGMRLTGEGFKGECKSDAAQALGRGVTHAETVDPLAKYLMQSLASETEFVMDNGQTKLLRLPEGQYQYSVQVLPQNPVDTDENVEDSAVISEGQLTWGNTRGHTIRQWQ
ncbi:MAG: hypothetical protein NTV34_15305 [Proteobacteria bacterium]|nr:hypothetical protein [Pseudomonadota bacterium]